MFSIRKEKKNLDKPNSIWKMFVSPFAVQMPDQLYIFQISSSYSSRNIWVKNDLVYEQAIWCIPGKGILVYNSYHCWNFLELEMNKNKMVYDVSIMYVNNVVDWNKVILFIGQEKQLYWNKIFQRSYIWFKYLLSWRCYLIYIRLLQVEHRIF